MKPSKYPSDRRFIDYMIHYYYIINIKLYLKNNLYGEESSEDVVCIAQNLKTQQTDFREHSKKQDTERQKVDYIIF